MKWPNASRLQLGYPRRHQLQAVQRPLPDHFAPSLAKCHRDKQRNDRETFHGGHFLPPCLGHTHSDKHMKLFQEVVRSK
jgi:hypothetical protein